MGLTTVLFRYSTWYFGRALFQFSAIISYWQLCSLKKWEEHSKLKSNYTVKQKLVIGGFQHAESNLAFVLGYSVFL